MSIQNIPANVSGLNMRTLTNSNFTDLDGRATTQLADIVALTADKAPKIYAYVEDFGAVGNGTTDDTAAIQAAIASLTNGGVCQLQATTYKVTAPLTMLSNVTMQGLGRRASWLKSTSTTTDIIQITGTGSGNCAAGSIFGATLCDFGIQRTAQASVGVGVNISKACFTRISNFESWDSVSCFKVSLSGNTTFENTEAYWQYAGSVVRNGYFIDSSTGTGNASTILATRNVVAGNGANITGLLVQGDIISDLFSFGLETNACQVGVYVNSTASANPTPTNIGNGDLHFVQTICDQIIGNGIKINNVQGGGIPNVEIAGGYMSGIGSPISGLDIESSQGVTCYGMHFQLLPIGALINGASSQNNNISSCKFDLCTIGLQIVRGTRNIVSCNMFSATSDGAATSHIDINTNAVINLVFNNQFNGVATNAIVLDNSSIGNVLWPNMIDPTSITNSIVAGNGKGNIVNGVGFSTPVASGDCTLGANSTNAVGTVSSTKTGSAVMTLTFDLGRMGAPGTGWSCSCSNLTTGNAVRQSASSTTAVSFSGTTNSGDVIAYSCVGY